jgi:ADP-heptose:LPS heptosyltransferase
MIIKKNFNKIEIILPPLIGDCVMVFNVINGLKKNYYLSLVCNEYTFYIIKYLFNSIEVSLLKPQEKSDQIIIDFLSNELSSEYLKVCKNIFSIGFQDGYFDYDYYLNQPSFYQKDYASSIFNQVFEILNVKTVNNYDFSFDFKWKNHNQQSILIIPGASIIDRCYKIEDFILLADLLDMKITFLLGPMDISLSKYIPSNYDIVKSNSIKDSLKLVSKQKLVVASEGGFMHISAAFGVPLIGLFKIAKKENWFPYKNSNQFAIGDSLNDYSLISKNIDLPINEVIQKINLIYDSF